MQSRLAILLLTLLMCANVPLLAMGEPPTFDDDPDFSAPKKETAQPKKQPEKLPSTGQTPAALPPAKPTTQAPAKPDIPVNPVAPVSVQETPVAEESIATPDVTLTPEELFALQRDYQKALQGYQFDRALELVNQIPSLERTTQQTKERQHLIIFQQVSNYSEENTNEFQKVDDLDVNTQKTVRRLYQEAQKAFLADKPNLGRDLLIQVLYLHRRNVQAKALLEAELGLSVGTYRIEDIESQYWNKSSVQFYGGNYAQAIQSLEVLSYIDPENALIFERMGSAYYMMGEKQKAIDAWTSAKFLNPANKDLDTIITKTKELVAQDIKAAEARLNDKKAKTDTNKTPSQELRLMGVFDEQSKAYTFASELKNQGQSPVVEANNQGKWEVKIPVK